MLSWSASSRAFSLHSVSRRVALPAARTIAQPNDGRVPVAAAEFGPATEEIARRCQQGPRVWARVCALTVVLAGCGATPSAPPATSDNAANASAAAPATAGSGPEGSPSSGSQAGGTESGSVRNERASSGSNASTQVTTATAAGPGGAADVAGAGDNGKATASGPTAGSADQQESSDGADPNAPRKVKYFASPDSLRVEVEGVSFLPKAELVKKGKTWSIRLRVETRAKAGVSRTLLTPQGSEIAVAGSVKRAGQTTEKFVDHRNGDRQTVLKDDKPITLTRVWPSQGGPKPLAEGDEVELMVGLWGFGSDSTSLRPLTKLCRFRGKIEPSKQRLIPEPPAGMGQ